VGGDIDGEIDVGGIDVGCEGGGRGSGSCGCGRGGKGVGADSGGNGDDGGSDNGGDDTDEGGNGDGGNGGLWNGGPGTRLLPAEVLGLLGVLVRLGTPLTCWACCARMLLGACCTPASGWSLVTTPEKTILPEGPGWIGKHVWHATGHVGRATE